MLFTICTKGPSHGHSMHVEQPITHFHRWKRLIHNNTEFQTPYRTLGYRISEPRGSGPGCSSTQAAKLRLCLRSSKSAMWFLGKYSSLVSPSSNLQLFIDWWANSWDERRISEKFLIAKIVNEWFCKLTCYVSWRNCRSLSAILGKPYDFSVLWNRSLTHFVLKYKYAVEGQAWAGRG